VQPYGAMIAAVAANAHVQALKSAHDANSHPARSPLALPPVDLRRKNSPVSEL